MAEKPVYKEIKFYPKIIPFFLKKNINLITIFDDDDFKFKLKTSINNYGFNLKKIKTTIDDKDFNFKPKTCCDIGLIVKDSLL